jgi:hypothetical protein
MRIGGDRLSGVLDIRGIEVSSEFMGLDTSYFDYLKA